MHNKRVQYILLLIALVLLLLFLREIDFIQLVRELKRIGFGIIPIISVSFIAYLLATIAWIIVFLPQFSFNQLKQFFISRQVGETFATLNPTGVVAGDALKYLLLSKQGYAKSELLSSLSIVRVLTIITFCFLILLAASILIFSGRLDFDLSYLLIGFGFIIILFFSSFIMLFSKKLLLSQCINGLTKSFTNKRFIKLRASVQKVNQLSSEFYYSNAFRFGFIILILLLHWICGAVEFYLILYYLNIDISLFDATLLELGTSFARSIFAFVPGQVGVEEYSNKLFLEFVNISDSSTWITVSIIRRIRQLFWLLTGVLLLTFYYRGVSVKLNSKIVDSGDFVHQS